MDILHALLQLMYLLDSCCVMDMMHALPDAVVELGDADSDHKWAVPPCISLFNESGT
jgi:hypothetical protein